MLDTKILGKRIEKFHRDRNLTQEQLAEKLEIDTGTIGRWLRGETAPSLKNLYLLAQILDVSIDDLVFGGPRDSTKLMSINYEWETEGRKESKPIISLVRAPRDEVEKMGLKITQLLFQGRSRQEIRQQLNIQDHETIRRSVGRIVLSDLLRVKVENVPLNVKLAEKLQKKFGLKTCLVADVGNINYGWLEMVILGGLGAKIITDLVEHSGVRLNVGFAGGRTCARVIISLMQAETLPKLDVMPIAVQPIRDVVALDANTLVGMLSFFTTSTDLRAYGLPYVSNAQLEQNKHYEPYEMTRQMLEKVKKVNIAFLGLGGDLNSIFHRNAENEIFCQKTLFELKQIGCIGDILYTLVTKDGPTPDLQDCCDQMVCSIGLDGLQSLSAGHTHVIAVARGQDKAPVARLALEKKYINSLIIDNKLAQAILE